ncbi:hypothetical protein FKR81_01745 [Lentzea tibetensis]|uniref:Uncharacterized protein n=1 Tax=Lentzea tibetensis TaxID=2591470 RepID=A0A563F2V3_9PSEU|nr:hypothetical protein [Lentzea tibetensis]TWP54306.1 hypothetical protein FKR81_01745 [Lentzea tibetensis]
MSRRRKSKKSKKSGRLASAVKSPWFLVAGAAIAGVSLVAAVVGPVPDLVKDETEVSSLSAEPVNKPGVTEFVLPLDVRLEDMPPGDDGYCTPKVVEWLTKVGQEVPPYQRIALRSIAQDGAMLAISNVRAVDLKKYDPRPVMLFRCPDGGNGDNAILHLRLDRDPQAQLVDLETQTTGPFAFNLQPGEQGSIELHLLGDTGHSYSGRIVADVATGEKKATVSLPLNGKVDGFDRVSPGRYARLAVQPGMKPGVFQCLLYPPGVAASDKTSDWDLIDCSPEKVRSLLAEIGGAP